VASRVAELAIKMTVEDDSQAGFSSVSRSISRLRSSAGSELSGIAQVASRAGAALKEGIGNGATFALGAIGAMARGAQTFIGNIISKVFSLKTALLGIATGALMKGAWDWLIDPNIQLENMRMTIETLVGDAEQAGKAIDFLMKEALRPGFNPQEVYQAGQMLVPFAKDAEGRFNQQMLEQMVKTAQVLKASTPGKTLEDAAYALREAMTGDWISLQDRFNIPRSTINRLKEAYGVAQGGAEVTAESVEDLRRKQRDLIWDIEELNLAMQEGERVQLGRVTSVTRQSAADLKQQHRLVQLREQLEDVNEELAKQEAALSGAGEGASDMEKNLSIVNDALDEMGYGFDLVNRQAHTTEGLLATLKGRFRELLRIMGVPTTFEELKPRLEEMVAWVDENWPALTAKALELGTAIKEGLGTVADWVASINWEEVGTSLKSWAEGFQGVATFLGEVLKIINAWPPWAKTLLVGGIALQATTGIPGNVAMGMLPALAVAKMALGGGAAAEAGTAAAGLGLGSLAGLAIQILPPVLAAAATLILFGGALNKMTHEEFMREKGVTAGAHAEAMAIVERRRQGLPEAGFWREGSPQWEALQSSRGPVEQNITIEANNTFQFDGTLSSTEEARLMREWADAIDKSFENVARKVGAGYKR